MGEKQRRAGMQQAQTERDQQRGFRSHIAVELVGLYRSRANIVAALMDAKANAARFREQLKPENALGSSEIEQLIVEQLAALEAALNWNDQAIDPLVAVFHNVNECPSCYRTQQQPAEVTEGRRPPRSSSSSSARPPAIVDPPARAPDWRQVNPADCETCQHIARSQETAARTGCTGHPRPMSDGRCQNHEPADLPGEEE